MITTEHFPPREPPPGQRHRIEHFAIPAHMETFVIVDPVSPEVLADPYVMGYNVDEIIASDAQRAMRQLVRRRIEELHPPTLFPVEEPRRVREARQVIREYERSLED